MAVTITSSNQEKIEIKFHKIRLDGDNSIFHAVTTSEYEPDSFRDISMDLEQVDYINSLGIAEIVSTFRYLKGNREDVKMRITNVNNSISNVFRLVELTDIFEIYSLDGKILG